MRSVTGYVIKVKPKKKAPWGQDPYFYLTDVMNLIAQYRSDVMLFATEAEAQFVASTMSGFRDGVKLEFINQVLP